MTLATRLRAKSTRRLGVVTAGILATTAAVTIGAGPASAAYAHETGPHTICSGSTVTFHRYDGGADITLIGPGPYYIDAITDNGAHADGHIHYQTDSNIVHGWVYNGYFC